MLSLDVCELVLDKGVKVSSGKKKALFEFKLDFYAFHGQQSFDELSCIILGTLFLLQIFLEKLFKPARPGYFATTLTLFLDLLYDLVFVMQLEMQLSDFFLQMNC